MNDKNKIKTHELLVILSPSAFLMFGLQNCASEKSIDVRVEILRYNYDDRLGYA